MTPARVAAVFLSNKAPISPNFRQIETGGVIPKEMLARMKVGKGDTLYAVEAPDGSYRLTPYDPLFARKMEAAESIMRRYRNTLKVLAE
jgi:putative addiction module antidote